MRTRTAQKSAMRLRSKVKITTIRIRSATRRAFLYLSQSHPAIGVSLLIPVSAIMILIVWSLLTSYVKPQTPSERTDLISTIAQIAGGSVLLGGLYFTWRSLRQGREGQITERFTNAITQLGNDNIAVRIGGIFALERIAIESKSERAQIAEILAALIRERTRRAPVSLADEEMEDTRERSDADYYYEREIPGGAKISEDVQAAITALGRRKFQTEGRFMGTNDLRSTDLRHADFSTLEYERIWFHDSDLRNVDFTFTEFGASIFENARLDGASLSTAFLQRCEFVGSNLSHADLRQQQLNERDFTRCNLFHTNFSGSSLKRSKFSGGLMYDVNFQNTSLAGATFTNVALAGGLFHGADLEGTDLRGVGLRPVNGLTLDQLARAVTDDETLLPVTSATKCHSRF